MTLDYQLGIQKKFTIVHPQKGRYASFPTMARLGNEIWLAYRSATKNQSIVHGFDGDVRLLSCTADTPEIWQHPKKIFKPDGITVNEIDAIISNPDDNMVFLSTRDYNPKVKGTTFLSSFQLEDSTPLKSPVPNFTRTALSNISDTELASFGHICITADHEYLMPGYSDSPKLLSSNDMGKSWKLKSILADSNKEGTLLTEFSIVQTGKHQWTALIRNETPPYTLLRVKSDDNCATWSPTEPTPLLGHAPMIIKAQDSKLVVLYRDLSGEQPGIGIGISIDNGNKWKHTGSIASYTGSIYDGGYGDIMELEKNKFLAVYYTCDEDASPWIEGVVFSILKK